MFCSDVHVLQLGRIGEREVDVAERLVTCPSHEVEAVALVHPRQPENRRHRVELRLLERSDVDDDEQTARSKPGPTPQTAMRP